MAVGVENFPNIDTTDPTKYPNGQIKDDPGNGTGTPIGVLTNGDIFQFFYKLLADAGITATGNPENATDGYQYIEALQQYPFPLPSWTNVASFGTQWNASVPVPQYRKDYSGRVYLRGQYISTGSSPAEVITTLPAGYAPPVNQPHIIPCVALNITSGDYYTAVIAINNSGEVYFLDPGQLPTASGWIVIVNAIFTID